MSRYLNTSGTLSHSVLVISGVFSNTANVRVASSITPHPKFTNSQELRPNHSRRRTPIVHLGKIYTHTQRPSRSVPHAPANQHSLHPALTPVTPVAREKGRNAFTHTIQTQHKTTACPDLGKIAVIRDSLDPPPWSFAAAVLVNESLPPPPP